MSQIVPLITSVGAPPWVDNVVASSQNAIADARNTLGTIKEAGTEFEGQINALTSKITDIKLPPLPVLPTLQAPAGLGSVAGELPAMSSRDTPTLQPLPDTTVGTMPEFDVARPVLNLQAVPTIDPMIMPGTGYIFRG
jgi:hypothetical protein